VPQPTLERGKLGAFLQAVGAPEGGGPGRGGQNPLSKLFVALEAGEYCRRAKPISTSGGRSAGRPGRRKRRPPAAHGTSRSRGNKGGVSSARICENTLTDLDQGLIEKRGGTSYDLIWGSGSSLESSLSARPTSSIRAETSPGERPGLLPFQFRRIRRGRPLAVPRKKESN